MRIEFIQDIIHRYIYDAVCIDVVYIFIVNIVDKPV